MNTKKLLFAPLIALLMLGACQNENKDKNADTIANLVPPPTPRSDTNGTDSMAPPLPPPPPVADRDTSTYNFVTMKTPPTYPGGMDKFYRFLGENIKYPTKAAEANVQGSVFISFTVEKDGSLSNIKVDRKLGSGTDEEAVRVLKLSKRWNPGMDKGKAVRANYRIPIKFNLTS